MQVKVPEEGDEEGGVDGQTRWRYFLVKIKWASSVNITDIQQYLKCVVRRGGCLRGCFNYKSQCSTSMAAELVRQWAVTRLYDGEARCSA